MEVRMRSPFPVEECLHRIEQTSDPEGFFDAPGSEDVIAKVRDHRVRLRKRRWYGHSFAPMLYCTLSSRGQGTDVACKAKLHLYPKLFAFVWFGLAIPLCTLVIIVSIAEMFRPSGAMSGPPLVGIAVPAFLLGFGFVLVYSGRRLGKREMPFLRSYLSRTLNAVDAV